MAQQLLMIEDDVRLAGMVSDYLRQSGYAVRHAPNGLEGLALLRESGDRGWEIDMVVLDLMLPDMDGLEVCRRIRALEGPMASVPLLMLTAKGDPMDRIVGLEMGADDYLPKPFEPRELLARVRAVLRRRAEAPAPMSMPAGLQFGSLAIDRDARTVHVFGQVREITSYQFTRDQIMEAVRGRELDAFDRSIDVHMGRIRAAIETDAKNPKRILTVRGVGYVFSRQQE
jgi:two-component system, OmpR family, phosphate regulon response regulator OmpR